MKYSKILHPYKVLCHSADMISGEKTGIGAELKNLPKTLFKE